MPRTKTYLEPKPPKEELFMGRDTLKGALAGMKPGESRVGILGESLRKPDYEPEPESLDTDEAAKKRVVTDLLLKYISPNQLGAKSTPELDRKSLVNKLRKNTLKELMQFLPGRFARMKVETLQSHLVEEISDEEKAEIQEKYGDLSP